MRLWGVIIALLSTVSVAEWIGEEYWTTVNRDGSLRDGRTTDDFLQFEGLHLNEPQPNAYIAFWITYDEVGHYETFGQAFIENGRVCARFVDRHDSTKQLCGGFRVLSKSRSEHNSNSKPFKFVPVKESDPRRAIGYRGQQIAKISSWQNSEIWFGSAKLSKASAQGVDYNGNVVKVHRNDPYFYKNHVFVLERNDFPYAEARMPPEGFVQPYQAGFYDMSEEEEHTFYKPNQVSFYHTPGEEKYKLYNSYPIGNEDRSKFFDSKK